MNDKFKFWRWCYSLNQNELKYASKLVFALRQFRSLANWHVFSFADKYPEWPPVIVVGEKEVEQTGTWTLEGTIACRRLPHKVVVRGDNEPNSEKWRKVIMTI